MYYFLSALLIVLVQGFAGARQLPTYIQRCSRNDPDLNGCVLKAVEDIRPRLKGGIPELRLPPLSPLVFPYAALNTGNAFKASFKDITIYGMENFELKHFNLDLENNQIELKLHFPVVRIKSIYNIKGDILILRLDGHGNADGNFTNLDANVLLQAQREVKKGREYFKIDAGDTVKKLDIIFDKANLEFEDIFKNNEELTRNTNRIISENIHEIFNELRPVIDETVSKFVIGTIGDLFNRYSLEDLFPVTLNTV